MNGEGFDQASVALHVAVVRGSWVMCDCRFCRRLYTDRVPCSISIQPDTRNQQARLNMWSPTLESIQGSPIDRPAPTGHGVRVVLWRCAHRWIDRSTWAATLLGHAAARLLERNPSSPSAAPSTTPNSPLAVCPSPALDSTPNAFRGTQHPEPIKTPSKS